MPVLENLSLWAKRTTQPHWLLGRTVIIFISVLILVFLLLVLIRVGIQPSDCPIVKVQTVSGASVDMNTACHNGNFIDDFCTNIIDNLAAGIIVSGISTFMLWFVSPKQQIEEDIAPLEAWNIREALHGPLSYTKNYWFRGRSGRFIRTTVMPSLHDAGSRESQLRTLSMLLPDPADTKVLDNYAQYRNSLSSEKKTWTIEIIQAEIFATIFTAAALSNTNHFFDVNVFMKSDFALFRLDMSDDRLIMTRENPAWPAIMCSSRSKFYASYHEEFRNEADNAARLDLSSLTIPQPLAEKDINSLIGSLNINVQLTDEGCKAVINAMKHPSIPYA